MKSNVQQAIKNLYTYNGYAKIPVNNTMITVPFLLLNALQSITEDPRAYIKELTTDVKRQILKNDISLQTLKGKLSTKVQEVAWSKVLKDKTYQVDISDLTKSITVPYKAVDIQTTMTVPYFLYRLVFLSSKEDVENKYTHLSEEEILKKTKKETKEYIASKAALVRNEFLNSNIEDFSMKLSQKVHELLLADFLSESSLSQRINYVH
tara:strand:+ start:58947 stop:59570 length:624 start_codon:yes stop_codon:yes gene_type:complete